MASGRSRFAFLFRLISFVVVVVVVVAVVVVVVAVVVVAAVPRRNGRVEKLGRKTRYKRHEKKK